MEATGVSETWTVPASKFGKATALLNKVWARGENEVICVSKNSLTAKLAHLGMSDSLYASAGSSTNKSRRFNIAVWSMDDAGAHEAGLFFDFEF